MKVGDLVEARFKRWLGVDYGIVIKIEDENIFVFWFNVKHPVRRQFKEELILMEKK